MSQPTIALTAYYCKGKMFPFANDLKEDLVGLWSFISTVLVRRLSKCGIFFDRNWVTLSVFDSLFFFFFYLSLTALSRLLDFYRANR